MNRQRLQAHFLYFICTVMLAVQWLPAHAHLDAAHQHDGARHEHRATIHAHQPAIEHDQAFDVGHLEPHLEAVVDLEQTYGLGGHGADPALAPGLRFATPSDGARHASSLCGSPLPPRPLPHVGEPRAPPRHA